MPPSFSAACSPAWDCGFGLFLSLPPLWLPPPPLFPTHCTAGSGPLSMWNLQKLMLSFLWASLYPTCLPCRKYMLHACWLNSVVRREWAICISPFQSQLTGTPEPPGCPVILPAQPSPTPPLQIWSQIFWLQSLLSYSPVEWLQTKCWA